VFFLFIVVVIQKKKSIKSKQIIAGFEFKQSLELKNKELVLLKVQRLNRGKEIDDLSRKIGEIKTQLGEKKIDSGLILNELASISTTIDFDTEKDWEEFKLYFEKLNKNFFSKLKAQYPKTSKNDEKLCAYIRIKMDSKQISRRLNVLPRTIEKQKYRLRKKMNLPKNSDIRDFLDF